MNNWSDDEDNNEELIQPDRDFPPSEDENDEEEEEYDMESIRQLTISKSNTSWADIFNKSDNKTDNKLNKEHSSLSKNKKNILNIFTPQYEKRKFNPRLPPPDKYKKINENEFPKLKN